MCVTVCLHKKREVCVCVCVCLCKEIEGGVCLFVCAKTEWSVESAR